MHLSVFFPGFLYENSTSETRFLFTGLTPYTKYRVVVSAKAAGELGPEAEDVVITPPEGEDVITISSFQMLLEPVPYWFREVLDMLEFFSAPLSLVLFV